MCNVTPFTGHFFHADRRLWAGFFFLFEEMQLHHIRDSRIKRFLYTNAVSYYSRTPVERPPHQRPSLLYDYILCDGQCFLFLRSLTDDHPSDATNDRDRWDFLPRERPPRLQCILKNRRWRFNIRSQSCIITMLCLDTFQVIQLL